MNPPSLVTRVALVERDITRIDRDSFGPDGVEKRVGKLERKIDVIYARVAIYAAIGSVTGGAAVALLLKLAFVP